MNLRNVAIIAHVDHGKTTLVDGLLKQSHTFRDNEAAMQQTLILDSYDQERERGITILAKNTAIIYEDTKINIIDTPGHADFSGEVERTLNMADGALLIVDAQEGPMPQTRFVLKKALDLGLKIILVINKIDKKDANPERALAATHDLFLDVASDTTHLDFPVYYAIGRAGKAWAEFPEDMDAPADLTPIFNGIIEHVPAPANDPAGPLQLQVNSLDRDDFQGSYAIGRIHRGTARAGQAVTILHGATSTPTTISTVYTSVGLKRQAVDVASAGDIVALGGIPAAIGDTITDRATPEALPMLSIEAPTVQIAIGVNTSPFAGKDGKFVTSRQLLERLERELSTNVALRMQPSGPGEWLVSGRGELHLAVVVEQMRREGYELQVGKPQVITKEVDGVTMEPLEELTVDVPADKVGAVNREVGQRKGVLTHQSSNSDGTVRLIFTITTRGLIGLRMQLMTATRGTAQCNTLYLRDVPAGEPLGQLRNGVLIAATPGKALTYGLNVAQARGIVFIGPQTEVYAGMVIGLNSRSEDIEINVTKEKKLSNVRASGSDDAVILTPPTVFSLEQCLSFLEEDELLEVTPNFLRLRKRELSSNIRQRTKRK